MFFTSNQADLEQEVDMNLKMRKGPRENTTHPF